MSDRCIDVIMSNALMSPAVVSFKAFAKVGQVQLDAKA